MKFTTKTVLYIILITAAIIGAEIFVSRALKTTSDKLEGYISGLEDHAHSGDWNGAEAAMEQIEKDWIRIESQWSVLIDHFEIDNIDTSLSKLTVYVNSRETSLALAEASTLKKFVNHIPQRGAFSIVNIL